MNFTLRHAIALLALAAFGLTLAVPLAASGMSLEDACEVFVEVMVGWLNRT